MDTRQVMSVRRAAGGGKGDTSGLLPDRGIVLHGEDRLPLLQHTRSAALAGGLGDDDKALRTKDGCMDRRTLFLTRRASIWSVRTLVRVFSALALWMYSIKTCLFLKTLPFDFW